MPITIVTAATTTDMTTLASVKTELGITDTASDTLLAQYIDMASNFIVTYCGRDFARQRIIETLTGDNTRNLYLTRFPLVTLHSITDDTVAVDAADYYIKSTASSWLYNYNGWAYSADSLNYSVNYTYGFLMPGEANRNLPYDIEHVAIKIAAAAYLSKGRDTNIRSETIPNVYSVMYGTGKGVESMAPPVSEDVIRMLEPYRIRRV